MTKDYYGVLGVNRNATKDEIKKAFRKLAQKHHPDKKGGDEVKFKELTEAYATLSDDRKRREYDSYGQTFAGNSTGGDFDFSNFAKAQGGASFNDFDFSNIFQGFGDIFGGGNVSEQQKRGRDISIDIEISFKDAVEGIKRSVLITKVSQCDMCGGTGAKRGTKMQKCSVCGGSGRIHETRNSIFGTFSNTRVCNSCDGSGKIPTEKCKICGGHGVLRREEEITITIPSGIDNEEMIRMPRQGEAIKNGISGDLYIKVHVKPHKVFRKEGMNLVMDLPVKITDALLGNTVSVTLIDGKIIDVKIPQLSHTEETLRVRGKGVRTEGGHGDLFIHITVVLPRKLSTRAKKAINELKNEGV